MARVSHSQWQKLKLFDLYGYSNVFYKLYIYRYQL